MAVMVVTAMVVVPIIECGGWSAKVAMVAESGGGRKWWWQQWQH